MLSSDSKSNKGKGKASSDSDSVSPPSSLMEVGSRSLRIVIPIPTTRAPLPFIASASTYVDPFMVQPFTVSKGCFAFFSILLGFASGVYTLPTANGLLEFLGIPNDVAANVLGTMTLTGNAASNTQQIYTTAWHLYNISALGRKKNNFPQEKKESSTIQTVINGICAVSGSAVIGFIAARQLQTNYPHYIALTIPAAISAFSEFFLGGDSMRDVFFKQIPDMFRSYASNTDPEKREFLNFDDNDHGSGSDHGYGAIRSTADTPTLENQKLADVFAKVPKIFQDLSLAEKNTLVNFHDKLYYYARTNFQKNPELFFSVLLLGKIHEDHPLVAVSSTDDRVLIVNLLEEPAVKNLISKINQAIDKLDALSINRLRLILPLLLIGYTCFSYLWDMGLQLATLTGSTVLSVLITTFFGSPGIIMMFALGVNLNKILNSKINDHANISGFKLGISIVLGLAGALFEAYLCATMTSGRENIGANWVSALIGILTKGLIINAPYTYKFVDALSYTLSALGISIGERLCSQDTTSKNKTNEEIISELVNHAELLAKTIDLPDLAAWDKTMQPLTDNDAGKIASVTMNLPTHSTSTPAENEQPTQSWASWFYCCVRKPYELTGWVDKLPERPGSERTSLVMDV